MENGKYEKYLLRCSENDPHDGHLQAGTDLDRTLASLRHSFQVAPWIYSFPDGYPSGKVGLYTNVAGVKFNEVRWWPDADERPMSGRWDQTQAISRGVNAVETSSDRLRLDQDTLASVTPILLKGLWLKKFQATFALRRITSYNNESVDFVFGAIAHALGVTEVSVSHWLAHARIGGASALLSRPIAGRPAKLSPAQRRMIPEFLWHGAEAWGFRGSLWTCGRIAKVIEEEFGVIYNKSQVSRLLKRLHWTPQTPIRRASQRDEKAIELWRRQTWPRLLGEVKNERRTLVFVDESGFYLLPSVVKTYAPVARTPVLRAKLTRDHLSVMGGMTPEGRVYTLARQQSLDGSHSVEFLVHLMRVAAERLLVIWDGSPIHRRILVRDFVTDTHGKVRLETLPGYAPDLNPWDEGGWNHLKHVEMRNLVCRDVEQLHQEFHLAVARLRQKAWLIHSFYAQAGLELEAAKT